MLHLQKDLLLFGVLPIFFFPFLTVSREGVLVLLMMATKDIIFPNYWFC